MAAPETRHHCWDTCKRAPFRVDPLTVGIVGARKHAVRMSGENGVDARNLRKMQRGILFESSRGTARNAGMAERNHKITLRAQGRDHATGDGQDIVAGDPAFEMRLVPGHDLGRCEANHADAQFMGCAIFVTQRAFQNAEGRQKHLPAHARDIRANEGKVRPLQCGFQKGKAIVEFVVADGCRVVTKQVHGAKHRVNSGLDDFRMFRDEIAERIALDDIAVVEEQAVGCLASCRLDQRGEPVKANRGIVLLLEVIPVRREHVQIGGFKQAQMNARRGTCRCGKNGAGAQGSGARQQNAT